MSSGALLSFVVIMAVIGAMLFVRFLAGTKAGTRPAAPARGSRVPPAPGGAGRRPMRPLPVPGTPAPPEPIALTPEDRRRRLNLAEARRGIVLATILGACRAHRAEELF